MNGNSLSELAGGHHKNAVRIEYGRYFEFCRVARWFHKTPGELAALPPEDQVTCLAVYRAETKLELVMSEDLNKWLPSQAQQLAGRP